MPPKDKQPLDEFQQAMLLIAMTQTALLAVIAASTDATESDKIVDRLNGDLSRETPNVAKWLDYKGPR